MARANVKSAGGQRNSNIELLRIISMMMIVLHHYAVHGGADIFALAPGVNRFILEMSALGDVGVILFVLITGFYLGRSARPLKVRKIWGMIGLITFYSAGLYLLLCGLGFVPFSLRGLISTFLPMLFNEYWFATAYVLLYIFHPYINRVLNALSQREELRLIWIGVGIFSVLHTLTGAEYYGGEMVQFILFYIIGDYLGRYRDNVFASRRVQIIAFAVSVLAIVGFALLYDFTSFRMPLINVQSWYLLRNRVSPFAILLAVSIFSFFAYRREFYHPVVNGVAATCFGIYLIHDNNNLRYVLWDNLFHNASVADSRYMIFHLVFCVCVTFVGCMMVELVRLGVVRLLSRLRRNLLVG